MKLIAFKICLGLTLFFCLQDNALSQVPAHYKYEYDQAGNRISRYFVEAVLKRGDSSMVEATFSEEIKISLFPNPSISHINLKFEGLPSEERTALAMFDAAGKLVYSKEQLLPEERIEMSSKPSGVYFVKLTIGEVSKTMKLVKLE